MDVDAFEVGQWTDLGDYYLMVGELVGYKRPDLASRRSIELKRLVVIGGGELLDGMRRFAGPT